MSERQFQVGQILYVGSNKKNQVVPVQVVKRTIEETIEGNLITYFVVTPKDLGSPIDLRKIKGQIFTSLDEARSTMIANAERASENFLREAKEQIQKMVRIADTISRKFPNAAPKPPPSYEEDGIELDVGEVEEGASIFENAQQPPLIPKNADQDENVVMMPGPNGTEVPMRIRSVKMNPVKDDLSPKKKGAK